MGRRRVGLVFGVWVFVLLVAVFGVVSNVPLVKGSGTIYIRTDSSIDPSSAPIRRDGNAYTFTRDIRDPIVAERDKITVYGKACILGHTVMESDIEKLKLQIGTSEKGKNYTQKIYGHGTGLRPPTKEEWAQIMRNAHMVDRVTLEDVGLSQSSVDHTTKRGFPPIGNQDGEGSCTAWAVGYYMKTFQEAKENGWDLSGAIWDGRQPSSDYQDRIISPDFVYHLINGGVDEGSSSYTAINLICSIGASSWETMPYDPSDHTTWPSEEAWREAPLYRGSGGWQIMLVNDEEGLANLKNWIASENLARISVDASKYSQMTGDDVWTLDNYVNPETNHANTIVGYDDNLAYSEEGELRYGAFKIANSWGVGGWEEVPDGCYWISYEAMKQRVGACDFYLDRIGYNPELVASFRMTHEKRGECRITVGAGSQNKSFTEYIYGGDQPFCSNDIFLDITEFKDAITNLYSQPFFLDVYDDGTTTIGVVDKFAIEYVKSTDPPISTVNGDDVYAYVTLSPLETNWVEEKQVCSDNDFTDSKVSMSTDSSGYLYVAYDDWWPAINQYAVFLRRSIDEGRTWSTICEAYDSTHNVRYPSLAIDPYSNDIFVAVEREWTPSDHDIFVICRVNGVWSWSIVANILGSDDRFPSITSEYQYESANWQYISYEYVNTYNDRDLMFARSTDHGATWSINKLHGDWPDYNVHAQTCITNAEGYTYIAYKWGADYNSPCEIRVDRSTDFGDTWTQFTDVDGLSNNCAFPSIAATHGGSTVIVAFQYDWSTSDNDVWYSYSTDKGTTWVKGLALFISSSENEKSPILAVDGGGSTGEDIRGYFHVTCKAGSFINYKKTYYGNPDSWSGLSFVSDKWVGKGLTMATQYRYRTAGFYPCIAWPDERTNIIYFSMVDTTPPTTTMSLSGVLGDNDWFTSDVTATLSATDDTEVDKTEYSFDNATWTTYTTPLTITKEGTTTIYYKSTDKAGNTETTETKTIKIDKTVPSGAIKINNDDAYATSSSVTLTLTAADATSEVSQVRFSNDGVWDTETWEAPSSIKTWTLTTGDGAKTVYYQIKDNAGLVSITYSETIILDTASPTGSVTMAQGATYTNSLSVTLTLSADDATSGIAYMRFSNDNIDWTPWEPYSTSKTWALTTGDGTKTVYVKFMDNAGLTSLTRKDTITLDTKKPTANAGTDQTVNEDALVTFDASASADESGISTYAWTFTDITTQTLSDKDPTYTFATPGTYTVTLKVTDLAGNTSPDTVIITVLDVTNPVADAGQDQTVTMGTTVTFNAEDSTDNVGIVSYQWDFGDGTTRAGKTTTHTYDNAETYTVTLTVKDAAGNTATDSLTITVRSEGAPPPQGEIFPMLIAGLAIIVIGIAVAAILLLRRRR